MQLSTRGAIDILSHESICLYPYLDSVGVWTIGAGITESDGARISAQTPPLTIIAAVTQYIEKIKPYDDAVSRLGLALTQFQHDALVSCCFNFGPGNLRQLCQHRSIEQIGAAIMLYLKPPEIKTRRLDEQRLYIHGAYKNTDGKILVFPVSANHHPLYHEGHMIDVRPYFPSETET